MLPFNLYYGIVENIEDPDQKSKVAVRILPEMQSVVKDDLPWLQPFLAGSVTGETMKHNPIKVGSPVWCIFSDDTYKYGWYISGVFIDKKFDHEKVSTELSNIAEGDPSNYNDINYTRHEDGTIYFHNNNTGMTGIYHNTGSYVIFDTDGNITGYSKGKIHLYNDNNSLLLDDSPGIQIDPSTGDIELAGNAKTLVKYEDLIEVIDIILANLDSRMMIDPLTGTTGNAVPSFISKTYYPVYEQKKLDMQAKQLKTS